MSKYYLDCNGQVSDEKRGLTHSFLTIRVPEKLECFLLKEYAGRGSAELFYLYVEDMCILTTPRAASNGESKFFVPLKVQEHIHHKNSKPLLRNKPTTLPTPTIIDGEKRRVCSTCYGVWSIDRGLECPHCIPKPNKYLREIREGFHVDVYDVLKAFSVTCPAMQHAIKKCLAPGQRGAKSTGQDKREAIASIERSIELDE